jgi:hypothetical protein
MSRVGPKVVVAAWRTFVHHVVHPISGAIVLVAAGVEVLEWLLVAYDHIGPLTEAMLRPVGV